ncbi:MAG: WD40 repeat domain-containing protein, partial [Myxococcota bacterium]
RLHELDSGATRDCVGHGDPVLCLAFSPDGTRLASGGRDRVARVWDRDGKLRAELHGHALTIHGIAFSPDGRRVATSSFDTSVRIFDADTGACRAVLPGHTREVSTLRWAADGRLVSGGRDGAVRVWDAESGRSHAFLPHAAEPPSDA